MASLNRSKARTWMIVAQCGALGFVAVAAMVGVVGLPGLGTIDGTIPPMPKPTLVTSSETGDGSESTVPIDLDNILASLLALPNGPKVPDKPDQGPAGRGPKVSVDPGALAFLGAVISQNHRAAMLRVGEERAWVTEGRTVTLGGRDVRLVEVSSDHVRVVIDDAEERLNRATRTGSSLSSVVKPDSRGGPVSDPRRNGLAGARQQLLGTPEQERFAGRRGQADRLLDRANELEATNPGAAETMRARAKQILSINPTSTGTLPAGTSSER